ncbi:NAD-dependent epimerase/dehydratase family protein [Novosphingobium pentaromativorans]|uniref:Nucleoside-diphosphate-sugar epimerase n=1 Tax=Novosphingobium pentaromativorans US6-1 TaxID=1088721 RepID=G6EAU9_9SPHN|nr:NAD(P)-dependent oxidoreductase [Novosphingobium pentaromativorans]AIT80563.1 nucleoside-diphosphate sugar epimerase [Novosphingobium pentaromativorans US6-1]EHJ61737.1 nucleoside-diphosphate-sugar epimerase [Novosphingobium pentaromativorans US6-1]
MKILVIGGNGMVGGHAALRLAAAGHDVTLASRTRPDSGPLAQLAWKAVDYLAPDAQAVLRGFDAAVFAAGQDPRHVPKGADAASHYAQANGEGVPRFFAAAKAAGVGRAVLIGSFYPQAAPELVETDPYVASRLAADEGARKLADDNFHVAVLNAPFIIGEVPGLIVPSADAMARWALGALDLPRVAPPGGVNVITCNTLSDAIEGALVRGENGKAWLIGDANLSYARYLGMFFEAAGDRAALELRDEPHPLIPDSAMLRGRGKTIYYDVAPAERATLGYRQDDVWPTIRLIVENAARRLA